MNMNKTDTIHAIEPVGDGTRQVDPAEISIEDVSITVKKCSGTIEQVVWLSKDVLNEHLQILPPDSDAKSDYDAVIMLAQAPVPDSFGEAKPTELKVDISVEQVRQAEAATCPGCGKDLRESFDKYCTVCGWCPRIDHLDEEELEELNSLQEDYHSK